MYKYYALIEWEKGSYIKYDAKNIGLFYEEKRVQRLLIIAIHYPLKMILFFDWCLELFRVSFQQIEEKNAKKAPFFI